jgi:hypothetical protein
MADDDLVPLRLVPVEVFGGNCATHCPPNDSEDCKDAYGLMDAVEAWSDCNRAEGHIYRIDETDPKYRRPGDTVEIFVRRGDLPWFERQFGEGGKEVVDGVTVTRAIEGGALPEPVKPQGDGERP